MTSRNIPFLVVWGPDILDPSLTPQTIVERLTSTRFQNQSLGKLYLDQRFLAGVGNYLRSEILFRAGVNGQLQTQPAELKTPHSTGTRNPRDKPTKL